MTSGFTKQVNCVAAAAYPFIPGPRIDDISDDLLDSGAEGLESAADASEVAADALKKAYRLGQGRAALQRNTAKLARRAEQLRAGATALNVLGYALAAKESVEGFRSCEEQP